MSIRLNPNLLPDLLTGAAKRTEHERRDGTARERTKRQRLSDDPAAVARWWESQFTGQDDQFLRNISSLQRGFRWRTHAEQCGYGAERAVAIGTEGANGTLSAADRQAVAGEVQGLTSQLLSLANTTYQALTFFRDGGEDAAFALNTTTSAVTYNGDANTTSVQLSNGNPISTSVPGSQLFQNASGDAFGALQNLNAALLSGTTSGRR